MAIEYVAKEIPPVPEPSYRGERYSELVPDTLDLAERAALAINGMTGPTDPAADYEVYWRAHFTYNPPAMIHANPDTGIRSKFQIALPLMRLISGSDQDRHVEQRWLEVLLHQQGEDGLLRTPIRSRPWAWPHFSRSTASQTGLGMLKVGTGEEAAEELPTQVIEPQHNGFAMAAAAHYAQVADRGFWEQFARRIVDGYTRFVLDRGDYGWHSQVVYDDELDRQADVVTAPNGLAASWPGWSALGLNRVFATFGYEPARDLAGKLLRGVMRSGYYGADGAFGLDDPDAAPGADRYGVRHFHNHTLSLLHALDHALMVGDQEMLDWARAGYLHATSFGEPNTGWFPERASGPLYPQACELCCTADMIMMALLFGVAGLDDGGWDAADRYLRNQFAEGQLRRSDWVYRLSTGEPLSKTKGDPPTHVHDHRYDDFVAASLDRVPERNIGAFSGWADVNDWALLHEERRYLRGIQHCCTGNAARAIYFAWLHTLTRVGDTIRVNLLLNRADPSCDVHSHIPHRGQVDVRAKRGLKLEVRLPEWVGSADQAAVTVDGTSRQTESRGRYLLVGELKAGQQATLTFPIHEQETSIVVERRRFLLVRRGNEVVSIEPPGRHCPLYQRDHLREPATRWVERQRFVAEQQIPWGPS